MFIMRFVIFDLQESSKYLIAKGRDEEAIEVRPPLLLCGSKLTLSRLQVLQHLARRNGKTITLTIEQFQAVEGGKQHTRKSMLQVIKGSFSSFSLYGPLIQPSVERY